ncbi:MAG: hypothetical protein HWN66_17490 [Candidatus Helarchaeota archaeon]|nr:hypothetical protein [Candidatus Helarchaeota archaeon]
MTEIIDEDGQINYDQALLDLKTFLYGRKGKIDTHIHLHDLKFYVKNIRFVLRSLSLAVIRKVISLWIELGYRTLSRYLNLNVIAVLNKLKEREKTQRAKHER